MGFLDKLLGRKKKDTSEGMQTAPPPASMPDEPEHAHAADSEGEPDEQWDRPSGPSPA